MISAKILKFVDDSKAMRAMRTPSDVQTFQVALDKLSDWEETNNMCFNKIKFLLHKLGENTALKAGTELYTEKPVVSASLGSSAASPLVESPVVKYLGVMMDSEANFWIQRSTCVNKTIRKASWVLRTFNSRSKSTLVPLWKSLIQPHMDYCSQLFSPTDKVGDLRTMEQPLRTFSRRINGYQNLNYWQRLQFLKLSLNQR